PPTAPPLPRGGPGGPPGPQLEARDRTPVLVVDDEIRIVELLRRELGRSYRVFTATSGQEALAVLDREFVVVVLADQRMPEMTGTRLMEEVLSKYPHTIRILLTGYTDTHALVEAINKGQVYRYVSKPWEPEELHIILRQGVERYELLEQNRLLIHDLRDKNLELQKALEELRKAQEEFVRFERLSTVGKMANMIVHDIKNPLTSVLGLTDMLLASRVESEEKKIHYYRMIRTEAERILRMVREILEYVRGDGPRIDLVTCSVEAFVRQVAQEIEQYLEGSNVRLRLVNRGSGQVRLDPERFKRVFHNLAANAREAMPEGGDLILSVDCEEDSLLFRVADTGAGIPEALRETIFEPFFTQGKQHGSGLGLTIVKRLVEAHHGRVDLESSGAAGTTFCIRLSLDRPEPAAA
ncbi:MAG: hybrid sensor histidine kinase/response regulator, partial [bacterium]